METNQWPVCKPYPKNEIQDYKFLNPGFRDREIDPGIAVTTIHPLKTSVPKIFIGLKNIGAVFLFVFTVILKQDCS